MAKQHNITVTDSELRNIVHGLQKLHTELTDCMQAITVQTTGADNLKKYYEEKRTETHSQLKQYSNLLTQ
jgi:hypothetical protein